MPNPRSRFRIGKANYCRNGVVGAVVLPPEQLFTVDRFQKNDRSRGIRTPTGSGWNPEGNANAFRIRVRRGGYAVDGAANFQARIFPMFFASNGGNPSKQDCPSGPTRL